MICELLGMEALDDFDITKTSMSVDDLLDRCKRRQLAKVGVDDTIADMTGDSTTQYRQSRQDKRDKQDAKEKSLAKWYGMQRNEDSDNDAAMTIFRLRKHLQPGVFVKSDGMVKNPKYFEIGTIVDHGLIGRRSGLKQKGKGGTILDSMMEQDDEIGFTKRKFRQIQDDKMKRVKNKRYIKMKRDMLKTKVRQLRRAKKE